VFPVTRRTRRLLSAALFGTWVAGCGLGLYDDSGSPAPGIWWTFVCPDGGDVDAEGGCEPPPCPEAGAGGATGDCE
jgi:hypothetical protein